jgi:hypothetical protein
MLIHLNGKRYEIVVAFDGTRSVYRRGKRFLHMVSAELAATILRGLSVEYLIQ